MLLRKTIATTLLVSLLVGCSSAPEKEPVNTQDLSVAITSWIGFAPLYVGQELGFYEENGVDLDIQFIDDIGAIKAAVQADKTDLTWGTGDMLPLFTEAGLDLKAFYAIDWSNGGDGVVVSDKYTQWSDFEGVSFAAQSGFPPANLFLYALAQNGVDVSKVEIQEMDTSAAALAFKAGQVDIAALFQPYLSQAAEREDGSIFISSAEYPYVITDYFSAKPQLLEAKKETIANFIKATDQAIEYLNSNPEEAAVITAPFFGLTTEDAIATFQDVEFPTLAENKKLFNSSDIKKTFNTFASAMRQAGLITKEIDVESLYTTDFVN